MTVTNLDTIVRSLLMKKGYTMHWYVDFLLAASSCLRELHMDDLRAVNTKLLVLNDYSAATIPSDCLDVVRVGIKAGQYVRPLVPNSKINSLYNMDDELSIIPYSGGSSTDTPLIYGTGGFEWRTTHYNEYGENTGRYFGAGDTYNDYYKVIPERNEIQVDETLGVEEIVVEYISDGQDADAASKITPYAQATIEAYINWQHKENNRTYGLGERQMAEMEYIKQRKILRARKSDLTLEGLKRSADKNTKASPK